MELREILRNKPELSKWVWTRRDIIFLTEVMNIEGELMRIHHKDVISTYIQRYQRYYEFNVMDKFWDYIPFKGTFLDVGANIGNHTLMFNRFRPNVTIHSFEPSHKNYVLLYDNTQFKTNITTYPVGLGHKLSTTKMSQPHPNNRGGNKIDTNGEETITIIPGDSLNLDNVTFIKMDVEGYEINALMGLHETISKHSPNIWIEDFTGDTIEWLKLTHGYKVVMDDDGYGNYLMIKEYETRK